MKTNDLLSEQSSPLATKDLAATRDLLATLESLANKGAIRQLDFQFARFILSLIHI